MKWIGKIAIKTNKKPVVKTPIIYNKYNIGGGVYIL